METKRKKPGPPKTKGKDPIRTIRVPEHEWELWREVSEANGLSIAMWIRRLAKRATARRHSKKGK